MHGFFEVSHADLDGLIHAGRGLKNTLVRLAKLDAKGKKFTTMAALRTAVEVAEVKAVNKRRKSLLAYFVSPSCQLFSRVDSVKVSVEELDELLHIALPSSSSASAALRAVLKLLRTVNERGQKFDTVHALIPTLHVLYEREEQGKRHEELTKQLAQQQQQLLLLQQQLLQQQQMPMGGGGGPGSGVLGSGPTNPSSFHPGSPPAPHSGYEAVGGGLMESFLHMQQQQQMMQGMGGYGSPLSASPPVATSPLYDYYGGGMMGGGGGGGGGGEGGEGGMGGGMGMMGLGQGMYPAHAMGHHYTMEPMQTQTMGGSHAGVGEWARWGLGVGGEGGASRPRVVITRTITPSDRRKAGRRSGVEVCDVVGKGVWWCVSVVGVVLRVSGGSTVSVVWLLCSEMRRLRAWCG